MLPKVTVLIVICLFTARKSVASTGSNQAGKDWTTVKRGTSTPPLEFRKDGGVLFSGGRCGLEVTNEDETTTEVQFSPLSPDGEYRIVIGDVYDFQPAFLIDVKKCALMHLPLPRYFQPWASWAPDGKHVLFYTNYEASPQLWILDLDTDQIREVHRNRLEVRADSCCGLNEWASPAGVAYLIPESVRWSDGATVKFRLEIFCNPYSEEAGWPCESGDIDHARAAYEVSVSLDPSSVATGPRIGLNANQNKKKQGAGTSHPN